MIAKGSVKPPVILGIPTAEDVASLKTVIAHIMFNRNIYVRGLVISTVRILFPAEFYCGVFSFSPRILRQASPTRWNSSFLNFSYTCCGLINSRV